MVQGKQGFPLFILGCGSVGAALARACATAGVEVCGAHCRTAASASKASALVGFQVTSGPWPSELDRAGTVVVAVPDPLIRTVATELAGTCRAGHFLHCSGARSSDELAPLRERGAAVASFHPLLSFADPATAAELLGRAAFAVEGDEPALAVAETIVDRLGGLVLPVGPADRVLYHGAAVMASNHLVALAAQAADALALLGLDRSRATRALVPLMQSTLANLDRLGLPDALTGPVSRGDTACVAAHLESLAQRAPALLPAYRTMARAALAVAREQAKAAPQALDLLAGQLTEAGSTEDCPKNREVSENS